MVLRPVAWMEPPGPAGACHRAGPMINLSAPGGPPRYKTKRRTLDYAPYEAKKTWMRATSAGMKTA
jgi:hypothetical protein